MTQEQLDALLLALKRINDSIVILTHAVQGTGGVTKVVEFSGPRGGAGGGGAAR